ncbi:hypothetical protein B0T11DRAFT_318615 [Plectosphaerella cucumerina]|uniref:Uncharacterized protein n=1 Tax=Plectosphaerella cucumerina TaxID=40658 RepID=A0A8K0TGB4_9PEZI|nr:hypothetical protein B0T11DRAFT_318615 [Plectosphaerella cucumerina]
MAHAAVRCRPLGVLSGGRQKPDLLRCKVRNSELSTTATACEDSLSLHQIHVKDARTRPTPPIRTRPRRPPPESSRLPALHGTQCKADGNLKAVINEPRLTPADLILKAKAQRLADMDIFRAPLCAGASDDGNPRSVAVPHNVTMQTFYARAAKGTLPDSTTSWPCANRADAGDLWRAALFRGRVGSTSFRAWVQMKRASAACFEEQHPWDGTAAVQQRRCLGVWCLKRQ